MKSIVALAGVMKTKSAKVLAGTIIVFAFGVETRFAVIEAKYETEVRNIKESIQHIEKQNQSISERIDRILERDCNGRK